MPKIVFQQFTDCQDSQQSAYKQKTAKKHLKTVRIDQKKPPEMTRKPLEFVAVHLE